MRHKNFCGAYTYFCTKMSKTRKNNMKIAMWRFRFFNNDSYDDHDAR